MNRRKEALFKGDKGRETLVNESSIDALFVIVISNEDSSNEALRLLIQRPDKSALEAYEKRTGELPRQALLAFHFKELFQVSRALQSTISFYKQESSSFYVRGWQALSNLTAHWYLRNFGRLPPLNDLLKPPYSRELKDLKWRKSLIAEQLGHLYESFSQESVIILDQFRAAQDDRIFVAEAFYNHLKPTFWQQHKRKLVVYGVAAYASILCIRYVDLQTLTEHMKEAAVSVRNLWEMWILKPLKEVYDTLRFSKKDFTIVTPEALQADRDSLNRMIISYAATHKLQPEDIDALISSGDPSSLLIQDYEDQLRKPIRGALFGTSFN